jgi:hypothetical protein
MDINTLATGIVGLSALLALIFAHARSLLRDLARTVTAWHELHDSLRDGNNRREDRQDRSQSPKGDFEELG